MIPEDYSVIITNNAAKAIDKIIRFYDTKEPQNLAEKIRNGLIEEMESLALFPERKPKLRVKKNYVPSLRFAQKYSFKIIFQIYEEQKEVLIVEIIHDKESPDKWETV